MAMTETAAKHHGLMSDWQRRLERNTLAQYELALAGLRSALQDVQTGSVLVTVDMQEFDNFVHDCLPDVQAWRDKIWEAV